MTRTVGDSGRPADIPYNGKRICPLGQNRFCYNDRCALWSDDWNACSLSCHAIHNAMRTALTDAAVEVIKAYVDDGR